MNTPNNKLESLFVKAQEGYISEDELKDFNEMLKLPENQKIYFEMIKLNCALRQMDISESQTDKRLFNDHKCDINLLLKLANGEKMVPVIEEITETAKPKKRISSLILGIPFSIAAVFIFVLCLQLLVEPNIESGDAIITDSINANWLNVNISPVIGSELSSEQGKYTLREGIAKLRFDSGAQVTIEAPTRFEILSDNKIRLDNGRIYAKVPKEAIGFSVVTPKCFIVDLGTEFGVQVDRHGGTELHVNKGRTVVASENGKDKYTLEVAAGSACIVDEASQIHKITCQQELFVREINHDTRMVWKGDTQINLADIVGGGNGWGNNTFVAAINPNTGILGVYNTSQRKGDGSYSKITTAPHPYIDGVFVPQDSSQKISSQGHNFSDCPKTNGQYYAEIVNGTGLKMYDSNNRPNIHNENITNSQSSEYPSIVMHSNSGITFDLDKIRQDLPSGNISRFTTNTGLSIYRPTQNRRSSYIPRKAKARIWVLLDGKTAFTKEVDQPGIATTVDIEIPETVKYLTLVVTDSSDTEKSDLVNIDSNDSDWCIFANPELSFTPDK